MKKIRKQIEAVREHLAMSGRAGGNDSHASVTVIEIRKPRLGWTVNGSWCPTRRAVQWQVDRIRRLAGWKYAKRRRAAG